MNNKKHSVPSYDHGSHASRDGYYTQAEWDRVVGWGSVPPEYQDPKEKKIQENEEKQLTFDF